MLIAIAGGFVVSISMLDVGPTEYIDRTIQAITLQSFLLGVFKGGFFGVLVAMTGCLRGMQCGNSAAAVGQATTSAVVDWHHQHHCRGRHVRGHLQCARDLSYEQQLASEIKDRDSRPDHGLRLVRGACATSTRAVRHGEVFIIMGGSGSGKSTLLKAHDRPQSASPGRVLYDGQKLLAAQRRPSSRSTFAASVSCSKAAPCGAP